MSGINEKDLRAVIEKEVLLVQSSMSAELSHIMSAAAHKWKQPLNIISMVGQCLTEVDSGKESLKELTDFQDQIDTQVSTLSDSIDELRDFFSSSKQMEHFSVKKSISFVEMLFKSQFKSSNIMLTISGKDVEIFGEQGKFTQVIFNLFKNSIEIMALQNPKKQIVLVELGLNDKEVLITVSDSGGGIDSNFLPDALFESNITSKEGRISGIGLFNSKKIIVEDFKGEIKASSSDGKAIIQIKIPCL